MMHRLMTQARGGSAWYLTLILACAARSQTPAPVLTGQYGNYRTSANTSETILTPSNVSPSTFGLLFTQTVDADSFAQTLYVPALTINSAPHNVIFVSTLNNSVYAFDADTAQPPLWHASLGTPATIGMSSVERIGILSTPVIDLSLQTMFVVTLTNESGSLVYRLHALNLLTGVESTNIAVQGAAPGTGDDSQSTPCLTWNGGTLAPPCMPFKAAEQLQRPALLEDTTAAIYLGFGTLSTSETTVPYHGWLFGYQYASGAFTQTMIFNSTLSSTQRGPACSGVNPSTNQCGHGGGIWMSGRGPGLDATGIYVLTGNGGFGGGASGNWGESALRLSSSGVVEDSFTPSNYTMLNGSDLDLSDAGAILFTSTNASAPNLLLDAGKTGDVYILNRASLGGLTAGNAGVVQVFTATSQGCGTGPGNSGCYEIHSIALWNRTTGDPIFYVWAYGDVLRVWDFDGTANRFRLDANQGKLNADTYPGGGLAVSANGDNDGIVWAIVPSAPPGHGVLYAFDAANVSKALWESKEDWVATKFTIPTIANGKVYIPTSSAAGSGSGQPGHHIRVYGLCANCTQTSRAALKSKPLSTIAASR